MSSAEAISIVRQWFSDRRTLARQRAAGGDIARPESVHRGSWNGLDTNSRDLAVEASVLSELSTALLDIEDGRRAARWGARDRIDGRRFIEASLMSRSFVPVGVLSSAIEQLLAEAGRAGHAGADLTDLVLTVTPPTAEDVAAQLVPHVTVTLRAVSRS